MAVIPKDKIEQAYRDAVNKKRQARDAVRRAMDEERSASEEAQALAVLARNFYGIKLAEPPPEEDDIRQRADAVEKWGTAEARTSIADMIVAHFKRHPEPATPSEVAEAIKKDTGRDISAPTITSTRSRNLDTFEIVEGEKRGAFRLKKNPQPTMFEADEEGRA